MSDERNVTGMEQLMENYAMLGMAQPEPSLCAVNKAVCESAKNAINQVKSRVAQIEDGRRRKSLMVKLGAMTSGLEEIEEQLEKAGQAKEMKDMKKDYDS